jgi:transposase
MSKSKPKTRYVPELRSYPPQQYGAIDVGLEQIHAGINGSAEVKVFSTMTVSVRQLCEHFKTKGVKSVAMEATGSLWLSIYAMLQEAGFEVIMVNGGHVKNLPGRKTDMQDCQWLAYLHGQGLLGAGFVPDPDIRRLRDYHRLRQDHISMGSAHIQHMQKALNRMNLKIHVIFSQTIGANSMRLIEGIVKGERDPKALLALCDRDVNERLGKQLLEALEGNYLPEHLFALEQALAGWKFYQRQIAACDQRMAEDLAKIQQGRPEPRAELVDGAKPKKIHKNAPRIPALDQILIQIFGHDLTKLPGITSYSATQILAEVGHDLSPWPTVKQFVAWLGLAPGSRQSGRRRRNQKMPLTQAGQIFCMASYGLARSKYLALGGFLRRIRGRRGPKVAVKAAARKLATMFYQMMTKGWDYVEAGLIEYEKTYLQQTISRLSKAAQVHGFELVPQKSAPKVP